MMSAVRCYTGNAKHNFDTSMFYVTSVNNTIEQHDRNIINIREKTDLFFLLCVDDNGVDNLLSRSHLQSQMTSTPMDTPGFKPNIYYTHSFCSLYFLWCVLFKYIQW